MILIKNALIVTQDQDHTVIRNGYIQVDGDHISALGPMEELRDQEIPGAEVIDANDQIAIPGFVCCHNHLYSAIVRSLPYSGYDDVDFSFVSWMERFWFDKLENKVNNDDVYIGTLINCMEQVKRGITTTADTVEGPNALPGTLFAAGKAAQESGMRAVLSFETTGRISEENARLGLEENINFVEAMRKNPGRIEGRIGVHTTYTCSTELIQAARREADRLGCGLQMHLCDDRWHSFDTTLRFGKRAVKYLEDIGFLGPDVLFAHASYIDPLQDPEILAKYDCKISHQAVSNAIFGFWPNMVPLIRAGVTVALGIDGMTQSMFEIMRAAQMIHRIRYENLELLSDSEVFNMATMNGARCLQKEKEIGSLEVGKKADIVLLDNTSPVPVFEGNVYNFLVSVADSSHVDTVLVDGQVVVRHKKHQLVDEAAMREECRERAKDFWKRNGWPIP
ncbi:Atrazine chlorohydrolase [Neomoorella glycerini]|uniref:Atrazine chlorohydrolase n=1 Tax=Neomoorella glycerini TaxID=55779 RepID=A0A6I5ZSW5_9FIRM|nr:amidohydrolase family protein [Moorella glycerini]QGP93112.1 Atrazine chlorohydrolase [Moorella glycerini]